MMLLTITVPEATRLSELIELGTVALIEREQRPLRAVLVDTAPAGRGEYLATFQPAELRSWDERTDATDILSRARKAA